MTSFYFETAHDLSDTGDTTVLLVFKQTPNGITFIGSTTAPVIINPGNVTTYIPDNLWQKLLIKLNVEMPERLLTYKKALEKDATIGSVDNPL